MLMALGAVTETGRGRTGTPPTRRYISSYLARASRITCTSAAVMLRCPCWQDTFWSSGGFSHSNTGAIASAPPRIGLSASALMPFASLRQNAAARPTACAREAADPRHGRPRRPVRPGPGAARTARHPRPAHRHGVRPGAGRAALRRRTRPRRRHPASSLPSRTHTARSCTPKPASDSGWGTRIQEAPFQYSYPWPGRPACRGRCGCRPVMAPARRAPCRAALRAR